MAQTYVIGRVTADLERKISILQSAVFKKAVN